MRFKLTSGSIFQGLVAIGAGLTVMFPDQKWIGFLLVVVGCLSLVCDGHFESGHFQVGSPQSLGKRLSSVWPQYLIVIVLIGMVVGVIEYVRSLSTAPPDAVTTLSLSAAHRPLMNLSNAQLRDAAIEFAAKMRSFEANTDAIEFGSPDRNQTEEQRNQAWNKMQNDIIVHFRQKSLAFSNNYLGNAVELRNEIILRLESVGILKPYVGMSFFDRDGSEVLDGGLLAGASPVTDAANYLEKLARMIPQP
jgi:hypothetical protein